MRLFFFLKMFKINVDSKIDKKLLVFQIIAFELVAVNSPYYYENSRSWQSTCIIKRSCTIYLLSLQILKEVFCERSPLKPLNKILEKYLRKSSFLVKVQLKWIYSYVFSKVFAKSLSNLVYDIWKDCFPKPKLLLAANRLIYLNMSIGISKIHPPQPPFRP